MYQWGFSATWQILTLSHSRTTLFPTSMIIVLLQYQVWGQSFWRVMIYKWSVNILSLDSQVSIIRGCSLFPEREVGKKKGGGTYDLSASSWRWAKFQCTDSEGIFQCTTSEEGQRACQGLARIRPPLKRIWMKELSILAPGGWKYCITCITSMENRSGLDLSMSRTAGHS